MNVHDSVKSRHGWRSMIGARFQGSARVPAIANFFPALIKSVVSDLRKDCFGVTPKPTRETRALPNRLRAPHHSGVMFVLHRG